MRHRHSTRFQMCEIKYHIKLPIFIARQWIRHRTANVNEYSARYSILDKEFYLPTQENLAAQSTSNRQGRGDVLEGKQAEDGIRDLVRSRGLGDVYKRQRHRTANVNEYSARYSILDKEFYLPTKENLSLIHI